MLTLLDSPRWAPPGAASTSVPATVPGALLVCLAALGDGQGAWVEREWLQALFWPETPPEAARRNLRVNLHRLRELLVAWGCPSGLQAERHRVRLALPTDLARLAEALAQGEAAGLLAHTPRAWLQGFALTGFDGFREWAEELGLRWHRAWLAAVEPALLRGLSATVGPDAATHQLVPLLNAWCEAGGLDMPRLRALDPLDLAPASRLVLQRLCARLLPAPAATRPHASTPPPGAEPLAGRADEQAAFRACASAAAVLTGEPGVGKTSLLHSCWPGAPMLHAREGLAGAPFAPLLDWMRLHAPRWTAALHDADTGPGALAPYRLDLARLLPELAPNEALPPLDARTAKARLLEALCRLFERQGPVLLVDDLQWCDPATWEWLVFMAHRGRQRWRATARGHEIDDAMGRALESLQAAQRLTVSSLPALSRGALRQVCLARWPNRLAHVPDAVLEGLHQACAGNALALVELMAAGADQALARGEVPAPPQRAIDLVGRRVRGVPPPARAVLEAAAVLGRPATLDLLHSLAQPEGEPGAVCQQALATELLIDGPDGLLCRHDLVRQAVLAGLGDARRRWLNRRVAQALGRSPTSEPLVVAGHWQAAGEPQSALPWLYRGALLHKLRGRFDDARALWQQVAELSQNPALALRARVALADSQLFHDLAEGRAALQAVLSHVGTLADAHVRPLIEADALAALIDNAVFSGRLADAAALAPRLRELVPGLPVQQRVHALEVLIELAMREPDIAAARSLVQQLQALAPRSPSTLSFEAQVHWFAGDVRAACAAFESLKSRHPDYCSGLTIENDLAVMQYALGELALAEASARQSLVSWQGVPHTECLSLLVLGSVLTSAGRHDEAQATLGRALQMGRQQSSGLFEAEALVRRARLWLQCGRWAEARADLDAAQPLLDGSSDPLRVSQYAAHRAACQAALGDAIDPALADRLRRIGLRSGHPLLHLRLARVEVLMALQAADAAGAAAAARRQADLARAAGLLESLCDALLLQARAALLEDRVGPAADLWREGAALADAQGFADLAWRAHACLAAVERRAVHQAAEREARQRLLGAAEAPALFTPAAAARLEPQLA